MGAGTASSRVPAGVFSGCQLALRLSIGIDPPGSMVRGDALRDNPGLVALTQAEKWDGQLPRTMLPGGSIPMLNLNAN